MGFNGLGGVFAKICRPIIEEILTMVTDRFLEDYFEKFNIRRFLDEKKDNNTATIRCNHE